MDELQHQDAHSGKKASPRLEGMLRRSALAIVAERVWRVGLALATIVLFFLALSWLGLWQRGAARGAHRRRGALRLRRALCRRPGVGARLAASRRRARTAGPQRRRRVASCLVARRSARHSERRRGRRDAVGVASSASGAGAGEDADRGAASARPAARPLCAARAGARRGGCSRICGRRRKARAHRRRLRLARVRATSGPARASTPGSNRPSIRAVRRSCSPKESDAPIEAPVNSTLRIRPPDAGVSVSGGLVAAQATVDDSQKSASKEQAFKLSGAARVSLSDGRRFDLVAIPDKPPTIALTEKPRNNVRGSMTLGVPRHRRLRRRRRRSGL